VKRYWITGREGSRKKEGGLIPWTNCGLEKRQSGTLFIKVKTEELPGDVNKIQKEKKVKTTTDPYGIGDDGGRETKIPQSSVL